jgi:hypothetical protein
MADARPGPTSAFSGEQEKGEPGGADAEHEHRRDYAVDGATCGASSSPGTSRAPAAIVIMRT